MTHLRTALVAVLSLHPLCACETDESAHCESREEVYAYEGAYKRYTPVPDADPSCGSLRATGTAAGFIRIIHRCDNLVEIVEEGTGCSYRAPDGATATQTFEYRDVLCTPAMDAGYGAIGVTLRKLGNWRLDLAGKRFSYEGELHWIDESGQHLKTCVTQDAVLMPASL